MKARTRGSKIRRVLFRTAGLVVVVAVGSVLYIRQEFVAAADTLPGTLEHLKSLGVPTSPHEILPPKGLNADNNAAFLYRDFQKAIEAGRIRDFGYRVARVRNLTSEKPSDLHDRRPRADPMQYLPLLRRAADREFCWFYREWALGFDLLLPEYAYMRDGARALAVEAEYSAMNGDDSNAINDLRRIHRIGVHAAQEPILIGYLVGVACDRTATLTAQRLATLWKNQPNKLTRLADEIQSWPPSRPMRHALSTEFIASMGAIERPNGVSAVVVEMRPGGLERLLTAAYAIDPVLTKGFQGDYASAYLRLVSGLAAVGDEDWRAQRKVVEAFDSDLCQDRSVVGMLKNLLSPVFVSASTTWVDCKANRATTVGLLRRLAGSNDLPNDPFSGGPLLTLKTPTGFKVYSVGADLQDNGAKTKGDANGDIVAEFPITKPVPALSR